MNIKQISFIVLGGFMALTSSHATLQRPEPDKTVFQQGGDAWRVWADINMSIAHANSDECSPVYEVARLFFIDATMGYKNGFIERKKFLEICSDMHDIICDTSKFDIRQPILDLVKKYAASDDNLVFSEYNHVINYSQGTVDEKLDEIISLRTLDATTLKYFRIFTDEYLKDLTELNSKNNK